MYSNYVCKVKLGGCPMVVSLDPEEVGLGFRGSVLRGRVIGVFGDYRRALVLRCKDTVRSKVVQVGSWFGIRSGKVTRVERTQAVVPRSVRR